MVPADDPTDATIKELSTLLSADDIVIVAIDEQSLRELGRWPWSRRIHADLVRTLKAGSAAAK